MDIAFTSPASVNRSVLRKDLSKSEDAEVTADCGLTFRSSSASLLYGLPPGRTATDSHSAFEKRKPLLIAGSRPARTNEDFPDPLDPITATKRFFSRRLSSDAICACLPKK